MSLTELKIKVRKAKERGHADHGWLNSYHTFSFADYHDPAHMGFRSLRVINDDIVQPGQGFPTHPHKDMEIITYVIEGALEHKDSMGNGSVIRPGNVQKMSAGSGITHSEFNHSKTELVHLLQIWIQPNERGLPPTYEESKVNEIKGGPLKRVGVTIHQDALLYFGLMNKGQSVEYTTKEDRGIWIHVISGKIEVTGETITPGDGVAIEHAKSFTINSHDTSQFLLFDLN